MLAMEDNAEPDDGDDVCGPFTSFFQAWFLFTLLFPLAPKPTNNLELDVPTELWETSDLAESFARATTLSATGGGKDGGD